MASKADDGKVSSSAAPVRAPSNDAGPSHRTRGRWPRSSSRYPKLLATEPKTRPTVLLTFAVNGATPSATSTEKVIRVPAPTTALIAPAAAPAARTVRAETGLIGAVPGAAWRARC